MGIDPKKNRNSMRWKRQGKAKREKGIKETGREHGWRK
jgi:hypothetical protein